MLLSPFLKGARWQQTWVGAGNARRFLSILQHLFGLDQVRLATVDKMSRGRYRDLALLLEDPDTYDQAFSLQAGRNILGLTRELKAVPEAARSSTPTAIALSESDQTINWRFALRFLEQRMTEPEGLLRLEKSARAPLFRR